MPQYTAGTALEVVRLVGAATTNATIAKSSPGRLFGWSCSNINAAARYLKIYNTAGTPVPGTTPVVMTIMLPAASTVHVQLPAGINFTAGIGFALVTGITDADTTAVAASEQIVQLFLR